VKKILTTPIKDEDLESLNIGDVVYLTGHAWSPAATWRIAA
jgi:L(+)-tartrate dehydratase beta subunit